MYVGAALRGRRGWAAAAATLVLAALAPLANSHSAPSSDFDVKLNLINAQVIATELMLWYNSYSIKC